MRDEARSEPLASKKVLGQLRTSGAPIASRGHDEPARKRTYDTPSQSAVEGVEYSPLVVTNKSGRIQPCAALRLLGAAMRRRLHLLPETIELWVSQVVKHKVRIPSREES